MSDITTAFWGMTVNNYDETDLALVQQGYPDHIRQIVYTLERGEEGTPHIQAFIKLNRQQRLSYVKKLFPRGNFKALTADVYKLNAQRYAQKLDKTAESPAVITNNPFPDPVNELVSVIEEAFKDPDLNGWGWDKPQQWPDSQPTIETVWRWLDVIEFKRVRRSPRLAKFYVSAVYRKIKNEYLIPLKAHVFDLYKSDDTHTHTHTDEKISHAEDITDGCSEVLREEGEEGGSSADSGGEEDRDGDEEDSGSEGSTGTESDDSGCSESDAESED